MEISNGEIKKIPKKRGPKQKKIKTNEEETINSSTSNIKETILNDCKENTNNRYIKPEYKEDSCDNKNINDNEIMRNDNNTNESSKDKPIKQHKKRGRKPKGGKFVLNNEVTFVENKTKPNIILHLKCSLSDIVSEENNNSIKPYNIFNNDSISYEQINQNDETQNDNKFYIVNKKKEYFDDEYNSKTEDLNKELWKKLKHLEYKLHTNSNVDKKSACFWCTYDFDNPAIYIPKYYLEDSYHVYGCFCSPECSCAYLMKENLDNSIKTERYQMLNHIYSKIYNYKKNIKPAPNPYYMLDKYYGNLSIQEFRSLLQNERLFLVVEKPLTKVMFELIEDNDEYIINKKIIPNNNYKIKKVNTKKSLNKNDILSENFC